MVREGVIIDGGIIFIYSIGIINLYIYIIYIYDGAAGALLTSVSLKRCYVQLGRFHIFDKKFYQ